MSQRRTGLVAVVLFLGLFSTGWLSPNQQPEFKDKNVYDKARLFEEVLGYVSRYYVDSIDAGDLYEMAIEGMLDRLDDPYTSYLKREAYEDLNLSTTGNYGGVGIRIESRDGWITIVGILNDTPGDRAGLEVGDLIVEIEGTSTEDWTTRRAADLMRGRPGTNVNLTIVRPGVDDPLHFPIKRARVHVNYVEGTRKIAPGIGYVRLTSVSQSAARELREAIETLHADGAEALILDLRGNPGGVLEQGVAITDLFLDRGEVVVEMRGRAPGASQTYEATRPQLWPDMPIVALVNRRTASAAEIIAGALQDHDRALVLGTTTFGKGVAYVVVELSEREALSVTTSRWYTPNGRSIDRPMDRNGAVKVIARADVDDSTQASVAAVYRSDAGRILPGGGGIQPDIVLPDTLSAAEQAFLLALGGDRPKFTDATARYALDLKGSGAITNRDFLVDDQMVAELLHRVRERGVEMPDSIWAPAHDFIAQQLGFEVLRFVFGRTAELERRASKDLQILRAIELLQQTNSQEDLFARASEN